MKARTGLEPAPYLQSGKPGLMIGASLQQAGDGETNPAIRKAHQAPSINRNVAFFLRPHSVHQWRGAWGNPRVRRSLSAGFSLPTHSSALFRRLTEHGGFQIAERSHP